MKLTTRVANAVRAFANYEKTENSIQNEAADFLRYGPRNKPMLQDWSQVEMSDQDMYTGYSYAAINKRANRAAALGKRFLYTDAAPSIMDAAKKQEKEIEHPYLTLIKKSKEFSQRKFWHDISTYLDLEGVYYLMAVRAVTNGANGETKVGAIQKFVMLNPYEIHRVVREADGTVGGYIESKNGLYREIPKEMIIEIRLLNPFDNDKAFSMTDAAKDSQFVLKQAGDYTRNSIRGNVNAPGILSTDVILDDHVFDNFISHVKNHDKGEPLYSNGAGGIHWESMQIDLDRASLDKINEIHRSILFAVSGTSKTTLGIEESGTTRDTSLVQKDNFTEDAVMPQVEDVIDALNLDYRKWYPEWDRNEYEIVLDNPLESDREAELKDIEIRETELDVREKLVGMGYEYDIAAKYAHGDISLEELGEPTLEPEISDDEADAIAKKQLGVEEAPGNSEPQNGDQLKGVDEKRGATNRFLARNSVQGGIRFVPKKANEDKIKQAVKRVKTQQKEAKAAAKEAKKAKVEEVTEEPKANVPEVKVTIVAPTENDVTLDKAVNQIAARDFPDLYEGMDIDVDSLGCIMMDVEKIPVAQYVKKAEEDLFHETAYDQDALVGEVKPHVTLLFGLLENGNIWKDKVDMLLKGWKLDSVTIEEVSYFDLGESYAIIGLVEKTPEIVDGHERLTLLPHVNTFSEYHPHVTLAYIKHDVDPDRWVKALGKKYNGQKVVTKGLNYGDLLEDEESDNSIEAKESILRPITAPHSHDHAEHGLVANSTLEKALNELDPALKDQVILQESDLQRAVAGLENDVAQAVIEALRAGDFETAQDIIDESQEDGFVAQLAAIIAAYYLVLFPIYAAQLLATRLGTSGSQGAFAMTQELETYIREASRRAAESHVATILKDFRNSLDASLEEATKEELVSLVQDKVNARDPEYMSLLPDNPNPEDVTKAVTSGKFDNHPAYKLARDLARQGQSLTNIEKSIKQEYTDMSTTRAKTIARHEASRVFNMSQYQADLQFLTETNNLDNAYKRLRSRTGNPCAVCALLIQKTRVNPIPFTKNFADLGEELTASYKKPNGKTGVLKVPVNYEAIAAGNVHVNCNCEYELVIKTEDGRELNDVRTSGDLHYNKFDPNQKRDKDGKWTDGSIGSKASVVISEAEAREAIKNSKYKERLYHGTSNEFGATIGSEGFKLKEKGDRWYGDGIYLTPDGVTAQMYAVNRDKEAPKTVSMYIDAKTIYDKNSKPPVYELVNEEMKKDGIWKDGVPNIMSFADARLYRDKYRQVVNKLLEDYDAVVIPADDEQTGMVIVGDPSIIKIFEIDDSKNVSDRYFEGLSNG